MMSYVSVIRVELNRNPCEYIGLSDQLVADKFNKKTIRRNKPGLAGVEIISLGYELGLHTHKSEEVHDFHVKMARS